MLFSSVCQYFIEDIYIYIHIGLHFSCDIFICFAIKVTLASKNELDVSLKMWRIGINSSLNIW